VGGACGIHGGNEKCIKGCGGEDHLEVITYDNDQQDATV
jgi:hypothetical protein